MESSGGSDCLPDEQQPPIYDLGCKLQRTTSGLQRRQWVSSREFRNLVVTDRLHNTLGAEDHSFVIQNEAPTKIMLPLEIAEVAESFEESRQGMTNSSKGKIGGVIFETDEFGDVPAVVSARPSGTPAPAGTKDRRAGAASLRSKRNRDPSGKAVY
ncbi:hypothetical protein HPB50_025855 [Hyalomma asiaticum]|uniref:Uncharacterized protein n=1 Tax=Hyalomma asiaticum TaxID=266040 RepID=A0ACB7TTC4_HYAAI|nr:hypothetical protein HPB50_025855 [Hyalomma asiaticum]